MSSGHPAASSAAVTPTIPPVSATLPPAATAPPVNPPSTPPVRLMCSYGGRILPRPGDHTLRYVGGETRMISLPKSASFSTLLSLLSSLSPSKSPPIIKYQLPNEDLDSLISLSSDDDLINMLDELDRLNPATTRSPRLRLFLFPSEKGAFGSVLSTGESNQWFLDALNSAVPALERRRSEASSSILSDQPDYLTGVDTGSDRSPVNPDSDRTELTEPVEPVQPTQPQEMVQTQQAPTPPVYYVPQHMPVYYVQAPVPYMQPSMDGRPVHGFMPVPMSVPGPMYFNSDKEPPAGSYIQMGNGGGYMYEQPPPGSYVRAPLSYPPPTSMYPPPPPQPTLTDPGSKPPPGSDIRG